MFGNILYSKSSTIIKLKELYNPEYFIANKNFLLIEDNQVIKMFSMKDFKFTKTIGKKGEGPGEFKGYPYPQVLSDTIMISSSGKLSFFDFSGNLIKEQRTNLRTPKIIKIKNKYVIESKKMEKDDFYLLYNLYDSDFKQEKVFYKGKWSIHKGGKRDLFEIYFYDVHDNKIIFAHGEGFKIEILDAVGNNLHTIEMNPPKIPFTDEDFKNIFVKMEENFKDKGFIQSMKSKAIKPDYYPDIRTCRVADGKIYIVTYLKKEILSECFIFSMRGKQLSRIFIPLRDTSPINTPPFIIYNSHLYQLVENIDEEQWQLIIDKLNE